MSDRSAGPDAADRRRPARGTCGAWPPPPGARIRLSTRILISRRAHRGVPGHPGVRDAALRPGEQPAQPEPEIIPRGATLDAFRHVLFETDLPNWLLNSLVITLGTAAVGILSATSAYAFSRYKFRGRGLGLTFLFATQLIPGIMLLVPIFLLAAQFGLGDTTGLVIAYSVTAVPFSIWILKGYYDTIPIELEEAARIDGCSEFQAFWKVLLPLSVPALAVVFLFNFLAAWGEYFTARIGSEAEPAHVAPGLQRFQQQFQTQWADLSASSSSWRAHRHPVRIGLEVPRVRA